MSLKIISILLVTILSLYGAVVFFRKNTENSDAESNMAIYLFSLFGVFFFTFVQYAFGHYHDSQIVVLCSYMLFPSVSAVAPSMFMYIASIFKNKKTEIILRDKFTHYIIPIGLFVLNLFCFVAFESLDSESRNYKLLYDIFIFANFTAFVVVFLLQNLFYIIKSWQLYFNEKKYFEESNDSEADNILEWVKWFIILYMAVIMFMYLVQLDWGIIGGGKYVFRFCLLGYLGYLIYRGQHFQSYTLEVIKSKGLEDDKIKELKEKLIQHLETNKPYLNMELSLKGLASELGSNSKYLSYVINTEFETNFSNFINNYRVEEAKIRLKDPENDIYTIQSIAEMTGFKSKSTFNKAFKDFTNVTPSQFRSM